MDINHEIWHQLSGLYVDSVLVGPQAALQKLLVRQGEQHAAIGRNINLDLKSVCTPGKIEQMLT